MDVSRGRLAGAEDHCQRLGVLPQHEGDTVQGLVPVSPSDRGGPDAHEDHRHGSKHRARRLS
eukprot:15475572-Alexandrium_andersonii.AAC.1